MQSQQDDTATTNLGTITLDNTDYTLPDSAQKEASSYTVTFRVAPNYVFHHWVATGSVSIANSVSQSTTLTVVGAGSIEAIYSLAPIQPHLFTDGFESGLFDVWAGTTATTGATTSVTSAMPHSGTYSGRFSVPSGSSSSARRAYAYENVGGLAELTASAYVYIEDGLPLSSGQNMWLIQFIDSGGSALASFGLRADSSGAHWAVQVGNYPYAIGSSGPSEGQWYLLEAYYTHAASGKTLILTVNGVEVASLIQNTSSANNVATARFGIDYYVTATSATVYMDDITIDG
jgi:hypothetical protein